MTVVTERTTFPASSNLEWAEYDPDTETLTIGFQSGDDYDYFNVPASTYRGLTLAGSAGAYFHRHIKGAFAYSKR